MQLGAAWAGIAIENSMLGAAHAAANPLTAHFDVVHGHAVGVMLPHVVRFNAQDNAARQEYEMTVWRRRKISLSSWKSCSKSAACHALCANVNVRRDSLPQMAIEAAAQWTATFNPREIGAAEFEELYEKRFKRILPLKQQTEKQSLVNEAKRNVIRSARFSGLAVLARPFMTGCILWRLRLTPPIGRSFVATRGKPAWLLASCRLRQNYFGNSKPKRPSLARPPLSKAAFILVRLDGNVYCLNAKNGQKIWAFETKDEIESAPLVLNNTVYIGASDRHFYAMDATTGKQKWKFKTGDKILGGANWFKASNGALRDCFWLLRQ